MNFQRQDENWKLKYFDVLLNFPRKIIAQTCVAKNELKTNVETISAHISIFSFTMPILRSKRFVPNNWICMVMIENQVCISNIYRSHNCDTSGISEKENIREMPFEDFIISKFTRQTITRTATQELMRFFFFGSRASDCQSAFGTE